MRMILVRLAAGAALAACAAGCTQTVRIGDAACADPVKSHVALDAAEAQAMAIADGVKREATLGAIRTARAALDQRCPLPPGSVAQ